MISKVTVLFLAFLLYSSAANAGRCNGFALECGNSNFEQCSNQRGCEWFFGDGLSHCAGLVHPCGSIEDKLDCEKQSYCSWVVTPPPPQVENHECSNNDFNICSRWGASCFRSTNNGGHPYPERLPPKGYKNGDYVAMCWWKKKLKAECPNTKKGGFWTTSSFGDKFGWSEPPGGWDQCMSQCSNVMPGCSNP